MPFGIIGSLFWEMLTIMVMLPTSTASITKIVVNKMLPLTKIAQVRVLTPKIGVLTLKTVEVQTLQK